jgi:hypothetical protein
MFSFLYVGRLGNGRFLGIFLEIVAMLKSFLINLFHLENFDEVFGQKYFLISK